MVKKISRILDNIIHIGGNKKLSIINIVPKYNIISNIGVASKLDIKKQG